MTKTVKTIIGLSAVLLVATIFYGVLAFFFWSQASVAIKALSFITIAIFIAWILAISLIKAVRFSLILRAGEVKPPFFKTLMIFIPSQIFTPLPGGEIGRAVLFKNKLHLEMEQVATPVFLQAVVELWAAVFVAILSILLIKTSFGIWLALGLFILLLLLSASVLAPKRIDSALKFFKRRGLNWLWLDKFSEILEASKKFVIKDGHWRWRLWLGLIALGIASHVTAGGLIWYIARIQGVNLTIFQSIFTAVVAILIQGVLGIIPGGLGVTEGGLLGVLASFGVVWNKAVTITLLYRILTLPLLIAIALVFLFIIYLPNIFKPKKTSSLEITTN